MYLPMQMGCAGKRSIRESWLRDDAGDNISAKNPHFCELTGMYWAWKNLDAEYVGLAHYRRYLTGKLTADKRERIATKRQLEKALQHVDVVMPWKRHYFIETNFTQYIHAHHEIDLAKTREIISEQCPEYLPAWNRVMKRTSGHRWNLFVMKKTYLDAYCKWLFSILFELERRLDISAYNSLDTRVFGLVSERLLDIWLEQNQIRYSEMPIVNLEDQHWPRKVWAFVNRKIFNSTKWQKFRRSISRGKPNGK